MRAVQYIRDWNKITNPNRPNLDYRFFSGGITLFSGLGGLFAWVSIQVFAETSTVALVLELSEAQLAVCSGLYAPTHRVYTVMILTKPQTISSPPSK